MRGVALFIVAACSGGTDDKGGSPVETSSDECVYNYDTAGVSDARLRCQRFAVKAAGWIYEYKCGPYLDPLPSEQRAAIYCGWVSTLEKQCEDAVNATPNPEAAAQAVYDACRYGFNADTYSWLFDATITCDSLVDVSTGILRVSATDLCACAATGVSYDTPDTSDDAYSRSCSP